MRGGWGRRAARVVFVLQQQSCARWCCLPPCGQLGVSRVGEAELVVKVGIVYRQARYCNHNPSSDVLLNGDVYSWNDVDYFGI